MHEHPRTLLHRYLVTSACRSIQRDDFSAWYEVFLDGRWFTLDARHNHPRIGRIVIARDVTQLMSLSQRPSVLHSWRVSM